MWRARRCESSLTRPVICVILILDPLYDLCHLSPTFKFVKSTWNVGKVGRTGLLAPWPSISAHRAETAKASSSKWVTTTPQAVKNLRHLLNYVYSSFPKSGNGMKRTELKVDLSCFQYSTFLTVSTFLYDKNTCVIVGGICLWRDTHTHTQATKPAAVQQSTFTSRSTLMQLACVSICVCICQLLSVIVGSQVPETTGKSHTDRIWQAKLWHLRQASCLICLFISFWICSSTPSQTSKATLWSRNSVLKHLPGPLSQAAKHQICYKKIFCNHAKEGSDFGSQGEDTSNVRKNHPYYIHIKRWLHSPEC